MILGVWELLLTEPVEQIAATVDTALAGYSGPTCPTSRCSASTPATATRTGFANGSPAARWSYWADHGHYPHLVDPDRFVERLHDFWT